MTSEVPPVQYPMTAADAANLTADAQSAADWVNGRADEVASTRSGAQVPTIRALVASAPAMAGLYASTADALSNGIDAVTISAPGTGLVDGVYAINASGGGGTGFVGTVQVVGGIATKAIVKLRGRGYTSAPALSTSLTGVSLVAAIGINAPPGAYFWTVSTDGSSALLLWQNVAGTATAVVDGSSAQVAVPTATLISTLFPRGYDADASGWLSAFVAQSGRVALGIDTSEVLRSFISTRFAADATFDLPPTLAGLLTPSGQINFLSGYDQSGYLFAVVDANQRIIFGVDEQGRMTGSLINAAPAIQAAVDVSANYAAYTSTDGAGKTQVITQALNGSSGAIQVSPAGSNNYAPKITADGASVVYVSDRPNAARGGLYYVPVSGGTEYPALGLRQCTGYGDSLTQGAGASLGNDYPSRLAALLGMSVSNYGLGGQDSRAIAARFGAQWVYPVGGINSPTDVLITVAGNAMPAGGSSVACTAMNLTLLDSAGLPAATIRGRLNGVLGTLSRAAGGTSGQASMYSFTPDAGTGGACPASSVFVADVGLEDQKTLLIWSGRNDGSSAGSGYLTQISTNIAQMALKLKTLNKRFLVLSILNGAGEGIGTTTYTNIMAANSALASTYGQQFVDVRAALVAAYNPSLSQDVSDHAADIPPTSLRADNIHLVDAGYLIVAQTVNARLSTLNWN